MVEPVTLLEDGIAATKDNPRGWSSDTLVYLVAHPEGDVLLGESAQLHEVVEADDGEVGGVAQSD
ncbi:hypothetical protein TSMEX_010646 [Taenia solium]|eukprot:TsM_001080500 transcript=TsM_001080500 gene=TsM_001080500